MECELIKGHGITGGGEICENCPYPDCIYIFDRKKKKPKWLARIERDNLIVKMSAKKTNKELSERFNLGERHIRRILERYRKISQLCERNFKDGELA